MFNHPVIIRSTDQDIIHHLILCNYRIIPDLEDDRNGDAIVTTTSGIASYCYYKSWKSLPLEFNQGVYQCTSKGLFMALSALRDDSDYRQIFIREEGLSLANQGIYAKVGDPMLCLIERFNYYHNQPISNPTKAHKATKEELVELGDQLDRLYLPKGGQAFSEVSEPL